MSTKSMPEHLTDAKRPGGVLRGGRLEIGSNSTQRFPVAVPDICLRRQSALASVDRCPALTSLHPPPAALGSLSPEPTSLVTFLLGGKKVPRRKQPCYEFAEGFPKMQPATAGPSSSRRSGMQASAQSEAAEVPLGRNRAKPGT